MAENFSNPQSTESEIDSPESKYDGEFYRSSPDSYIENRSPSNPDLDELGISKQEFSMISTKAFNKLLKEKKISKERKRKIKKRKKKTQESWIHCNLSCKKG